MSMVVIAIFAIALSVLTLGTLRYFDRHRLNFFDGLIVGMIYFYIIPLFLGIFQGSIPTVFPYVNDYHPDQDLRGTLVIFMGWITVLCLYIGVRLLGWPRPDIRRVRPLRYLPYYFAVLYLGLAITVIILGGMGNEGAHWRLGVQELQRSSASYSVLRSFANALRFMVGGIFVFAAFSRQMSRQTALIWLAGLTVFDLFTTYNRVGLVFFALAAALLYWRYWKWILAGLLIIAPTVSYVSTTWSVFRSVHSVSGGGIASIPDDWERARDILDRNNGTILNTTGQSLFEANELAMLNFVVEDLPKRVPPLMGATMFVRPLTVFVPGAIWENKPPVFANIVGSYASSVEGISLNSTIIGEAFGNFSYLFPIPLMLALLIYGLIFRLLDRKLPGTNFVGFFIGATMWRFDMNFAASSVVALLLLLLFVLVARAALPFPEVRPGARPRRQAPRPAGRPLPQGRR